jgi:predicted peptidase
MKTQVFFILTWLITISSSNYLQGQNSKQSPQAGMQVCMKEGLVGNILDNYWVYLPRTFKTEKKIPILVFLQGGLGVSNDSTSVIRYGVDKYTFMDNANKELDSYVKDSFIIINPHLIAGDFWERQWYQQYSSINSILNYIIKNYAGDSTRIYVTGLSRGGHGTWGIGQLLNKRIAAIIPICGQIHGVTDFSCFKDMPIWTICNTGDDLYKESVEAVKLIEGFSGNKFLRLNTAAPTDDNYLKTKHIFSSFEKDGHDAWTATYDKVEIYKWLLKQKKIY